MCAVAFSQFIAACTAALLAAGSAPALDASAPPKSPPLVSRCRPGDQLWLVSSRRLGCGDVLAPGARLQVWRYHLGLGWQPSTVEDLVAAGGPGVNTALFAHGNRIVAREAESQGLLLYRRLAAATCDDEPLRLVIWSWPSQRTTHGPLDDARLKACRSDLDAYFLAWLLDQLDPQERVGLLAYSLGARVEAGALHLLGRGELAGRRLDPLRHQGPRPLRAVWMAAALDCDWLWPGRRLDQALPQLESLLLVNNPCDWVLKRYPRLESRRSGSQALGYVGLGPNSLPLADWAKVEQTSACPWVGRAHRFEKYVNARVLLGQAWSALSDPSAAAP